MTMFQFDRPPVIGTILRVDRQEYYLMEAQPYIRKDGGESLILRWESLCPSCGESFECTTGTGGHTPVRRCSSCRGRGGRVRKGRGNRPLPVGIIEG